MAMLKSALVALLAGVVLVGCANMQPGQQPQPAPTQPDSQKTAVAQTSAPMHVTFPTSKGAPQGKPWGTMHAQGFTGGYDVACKLLGLTHNQCVMYQEMHSRGACQTMDVPNGVVLDRLTFTREGKHQVDYGALVALRNPPTRKTEVCDLGGGVIAMRFHGCNNHGIVRGWAPKSAPVVVQPTACVPEHLVELAVWEEKAVMILGVSQAIAASRSGAGYFASGDVSRRFGAVFRKARAEGKLSLSTTSHHVTVTLLKSNGQSRVLFQGTVTGVHRFPIPSDFVEGDMMRVMFHDLSTFHSPVSDLRAARNEFVSRGCKSITAMNAIERGSGSAPQQYSGVSIR